ncbi:MAG: hypothetical protein IKX59_11180 [Bacteroidales bacterium]|nr:hypothetical protein [Bacteroidales bacterium]
MKRCLLFIIYIFSICIAVQAAGFRPIITNYTSEVYGFSAGTQIWSCSQDDNGIVYFASNKGLLVFDSYQWTNVSLADNTIIRSVKVIGDRIYVGTYEDFGYFHYDAFGHLEYTSLRPLVGDFPMKNEEPWFILQHGDEIYFQSFASIFRYNPQANEGQGSVTPISINDKHPLYLHQVNGQLWAQLIEGGYYRMIGQDYELAIPPSNYGNSRIVASFELRAGGDMLLCTEDAGLFVHRAASGLTAPYHTTIDGQLQRAMINRAVITRDSILVIGTIRDGIFGLDLGGKLLWHYDLSDGLINNSVLNLFCDRDNNVWACLDSGIALIHCGIPITCFKPSPAEQSIGTVFGILPLHDELLMATNEGFYHCELDGNSPARLVAGTEGQNWHITRIGQQLFLGSNRSTYMVDVAHDYRLTSVPNTDGSSTCVRQCRIWNQDVLIESSYNELRVYRQQNGRWTLSHTVEGFSYPIRHFEVDNEGRIWAANMQKGIFCITLDRELRTIEQIRSFHRLDNGEEGASTCYVMKIFGRIVMSDEQRLYTFDDMSGRIVPHDRLNNLLVSTRDIYNATDAGVHGVWLAGQKGYALIDRKADSLFVRDYIPVSMLGLLAGDRCANVFMDGDYAYFNMSGGVVRYDLTAHRFAPLSQPHIAVSSSSYSTTDGDRHDIALGELINGNPVIEPNLSLLFSYPDYNGNCASFRYTLQGDTPRDIPTTDRRLTLNNLKPGAYTLKVEALSSFGDALDTLQLHFHVPQPWYLRWWALLLFLVIIGIIAWSYGRWNARRVLLQQKHRHEEESREQRIIMLEQERLIAEQQRQILETELSTKSKDLATLAMDVFSKEKVIENLRESMQEEQRKGNISVREMNALLKRIQQTEGNLEFWSIYQKNFDLIHEHFFRNLQERYPSLTSSDLKFCALLRLNLSTKQIATFTNLSVRGVESARLRLRRKLGLTADQNLVDFLISF